MSDEEATQGTDTEATKPPRPVDPGPASTPAERQAYAEAVRDWEEWLKDHPENGDDDGVEQELEEEQARDANQEYGSRARARPGARVRAGGGGSQDGELDLADRAHGRNDSSAYGDRRGHDL